MSNLKLNFKEPAKVFNKNIFDILTNYEKFYRSTLWWWL